MGRAGDRGGKGRGGMGIEGGDKDGIGVGVGIELGIEVGIGWGEVG